MTESTIPGSVEPALVGIGPIELRLPPEPALSRVVRLAASGIASLHGMTVNRIEDIKVAVSEVLLALIEHGAGEPIGVQFNVDAESFTVRASTAAATLDLAHPDLLLCRQVLADVCSHQSVELVGTSIEIIAVIDRTSTS